MGSRGQEVSRPVSIETSMAARACSWEGSCCCHIFTDIRAGEALKPVSARRKERISEFANDWKDLSREIEKPLAVAIEGWREAARVNGVAHQRCGERLVNGKSLSLSKFPMRYVNS